MRFLCVLLWLGDQVGPVACLPRAHGTFVLQRLAVHSNAEQRVSLQLFRRGETGGGDLGAVLRLELLSENSAGNWNADSKPGC